MSMSSDGELRGEPPQPYVLAPELERAYSAACYEVDAGPTALVLLVGTPTPSLSALPGRPRRLAVITAWNPFSRQQRAEVNVAANAKLAGALVDAGYLTWPAHGRDLSGAWPPEASFAVPDITDEHLDNLMLSFDQYAVVVADEGALVGLRWNPRHESRFILGRDIAEGLRHLFDPTVPPPEERYFQGVDLHFAPSGYFKPQRLDRYLMTRIRGTRQREILEKLLSGGIRLDTPSVTQFLAEGGFSQTELRAIEAMHPRLMGGNYLPALPVGAVEIARISIASTTGDVTVMTAEADDGRIRYRMADEYGGETLVGPAETYSDKPLTLRQLFEKFINAWDLMDCLKSNFEDDVAAMLSFFVAESDVYPQFDALCRAMVVEQFGEAGANARNPSDGAP
jgi:hypothetical protein